MATLFAARAESVEGFSKVVAIKLMLPHIAEEPRFEDMFLDEARLAAQVSHPNVVQVFDSGRERDTLYIAMEYVSGQAFSLLLRKMDKKHPRRVEVITSILEQAARGLHAAHIAKNYDGEPLEIVHRDVSPQNVLVGYDGVARIVDFGVASGVGRRTNTVTGEIKGKLAFLAPEQINADGRADPRTDVWAWGVTAWQAFARERLFTGKNDGEVLWSVMSRDIPPLASRCPDLDPRIASIVDQCLRRDRRERPQSAGLIASVMGSALTDHGQAPDHVAQAMSEVFAHEQSVESERIAAALRSGTVPALRVADVDIDVDVEDSESSMSAPLPASRPPFSRMRWVAMGALALGLLTLSGAFAWAELDAANASMVPSEEQGGVSSPPRQQPPAPNPATLATVGDREVQADDAGVEMREAPSGRRSAEDPGGRELSPTQPSARPTTARPRPARRSRARRRSPAPEGLLPSPY